MRASQEGASWGVWAAVHAEVRSNIAAIRKAVQAASLDRLIIVGHSLGGAYAQEVARCLLLSSSSNLEMQVVTFGSPTVFARRESAAPRRTGGEGGGSSKGGQGWKVVPTLVQRVVGMMRGSGGRAEEDWLMRRLSVRSLHVVHRWDVMPRVHLLPSLLRHSQGKAMLKAWAKHFASKVGGAYAARLSGYLSDALAIAQNVNRTYQARRLSLDRYQGVGDYMLVPPGIICDLTQIQDTAMPVAWAHVLQASDPMPEWDVSLDPGLGIAGDEPWVAMLKDHALYQAAVAATPGMHQIVHELCLMHVRERGWGGGGGGRDTGGDADCRSLGESVGVAGVAGVAGVEEGLSPPALLRAFEDWYVAVKQQESDKIAARRQREQAREHQYETHAVSAACQTTTAHPAPAAGVSPAKDSGGGGGGGYLWLPRRRRERPLQPQPLPHTPATSLPTNYVQQVGEAGHEPGGGWWLPASPARDTGRGVYAVPVQNAEDESVLWGRGRERKGRPGEEERDLEEEEEEVIGRGGYDVSPP